MPSSKLPRLVGVFCLGDHAHRHGENVAVRKLAGEKGPGNPCHPFDALPVVGEAEDHLIRELKGTDPGGVGDTGSAVDQDVIVGFSGAATEPVDEACAVEGFVEAGPLEGIEAARIAVVLSAGPQQVKTAVSRKIEHGVHGMPLRVCQVEGLRQADGPVLFRQLDHPNIVFHRFQQARGPFEVRVL